MYIVYTYICVYVYIMYLMSAACVSGKNSVERKKPKSTEGCFDELFFCGFLSFFLSFLPIIIDVKTTDAGTHRGLCRNG